MLVAGFSKAYSSLLAFIACPPKLKSLLKVAAPPYLYSGPSPIASLATVLAGLQVNDERGDEIRKDLQQMEELVEDPLTDLHAKIPHGEGQTILRQALLIADHNAYHLGVLAAMARILKAGPDN